MQQLDQSDILLHRALAYVLRRDTVRLHALSRHLHLDILATRSLLERLKAKKYVQAEGSNCL